MYLDGLDKMIYTLLGICVVSVPLGLWKLVEIILWLVRHVRVEVAG